MEDKQLIVDRLRTYRVNKKLSIEKLAREMNLSYITVQRWLVKKCEPSPMGLATIESYLNRKNGS